MNFFQTFSGVPSRTDISLISTTVSLYEGSARSVLDRPLVVYSRAEDFSRSKKYEKDFDSERFLACGMIRSSSKAGSSSFEKESAGSETFFKVDKTEKSFLEGEKSWGNVHHPYYGASKVASNLNVLGVERPDLSADSLSLKTTVPTRKGIK